MSVFEQGATSITPAFKKRDTFVVWAVISASLAGTLFGYDNGVISRAILFIKRGSALPIGLEKAVVSIVSVAAIMSAVTGGYSADMFGPCTVLIRVASTFTVEALFTATAPDIILLALRLVRSIEPALFQQFTMIYYARPSPRRSSFPRHRFWSWPP